MTKKEIKDIFRNIVRTWPDTGCARPNTFFVIDTGDEFETENLKATYSDYQKGDFWSRRWVLQGANPETLCKQYPIIGLEQKSMRLPETFANSICYDYWVILADTPDCEGCDSTCQRTKDEVDNDLFVNSVILLQELKRYKKYKLSKNGNSWEAWMTSDWVQFLLASGDIDSWSDLCDYIEMMVSDAPIEIRSSNIGLTDGARAVAFPLSFCDCAIEQTPFDYNIREPDGTATTKCPTC